jgi:hypothetical protein
VIPLWVIAALLLALGCTIGFLAWRLVTRQPLYRLHHDRLLAADLPVTTPCGVCGEPRNAGLVVRTPGATDMPVCGGCAFAGDEVPAPRPQRRQLRRVPLEDSDFLPIRPAVTKARPATDALSDALSMAWSEGAISDDEYERLKILTPKE